MARLQEHTDYVKTFHRVLISPTWVQMKVRNPTLQTIKNIHAWKYLRRDIAISIRKQIFYGSNKLFRFWTRLYLERPIKRTMPEKASTDNQSGRVWKLFSIIHLEVKGEKPQATAWVWHNWYKSVSNDN